jgi:hypothetical protein
MEFVKQACNQHLVELPETSAQPAPQIKCAATDCANHAMQPIAPGDAVLLLVYVKWELQSRPVEPWGLLVNRAKAHKRAARECAFNHATRRPAPGAAKTAFANRETAQTFAAAAGFNATHAAAE